MTQPFFIIFFPITTQSSSQRSWKEKLLIRYTIILNAAQVEWRNPLPSTCHSDDHREKESHAKCYSPLLVWCGMEHRRISHQARVQNIRGLIPIRPRSTHYIIIKPKSYYIKYSIFVLHSKDTGLLFPKQYRNIGNLFQKSTIHTIKAKCTRP